MGRFKDCPVVAVAAKPGGPEAADTDEPQGIPELVEVRTHHMCSHAIHLITGRVGLRLISGCGLLLCFCYT